MKKVLLVTFIFCLLASSAMSFDGMRKGFVLGGGLGFSPTAEWKIDNSEYSEKCIYQLFSPSPFEKVISYGRK